jgi:hypothetical protein
MAGMYGVERTSKNPDAGDHGVVPKPKFLDVMPVYLRWIIARSGVP